MCIRDRIMARELAERGYTILYIRRFEGGELKDVEEICRRIERFVSKIVAVVDDIDALFVPDPYKRGAILDQIESFKYFLILTVNPEKIPDADLAKLRRLDLVLDFGIPNRDDMKEIVKKIAKRYNFELSNEEVDEIVRVSEGEPPAFIDLLFKRKILEPERRWGELSKDLKKTLSNVRGIYYQPEEAFTYT